MKNFLKIQSWNFCDKVHPSFRFSLVRKDNYCLERQEKMSILEYLNVIPQKKFSTQQQSLLKELILFVNSETFQREFKYSLSNENRIFKFYLLNVSLLAHRAEEFQSEFNYSSEFFATKKKKKFLENFFKNFKNFVNIFSLNFSYKFLPLHFIYEEFYREYVKRHLIKDSFQEVFTEKYFKKMKMLDIKYLRYRAGFANELNQLNDEIEAFFLEECNSEKKFEDLLKENENFAKKYDAFLRKYFIGFIFELKAQDKAKAKGKDGADKKLDEMAVYRKDVDKLFTYFLAHVFFFLIDNIGC